MVHFPPQSLRESLSMRFLSDETMLHGEMDKPSRTRLREIDGRLELNHRREYYSFLLYMRDFVRG